MRYMLLLHTREAEMRQRTPEWIEEAASYLARFEDRLASNSELEWTEVLGDEDAAVVIGPGAETRPGWYNENGRALSRVWAVRVESVERVTELAGELAGELDTWIEVRECMPSSQRP
ncbi:hypothetical protein [Leucobacter sp. GX24907]